MYNLPEHIHQSVLELQVDTSAHDHSHLVPVGFERQTFVLSSLCLWDKCLDIRSTPLTHVLQNTLIIKVQSVHWEEKWWQHLWRCSWQILSYNLSSLSYSFSSTLTFSSMIWVMYGQFIQQSEEDRNACPLVHLFWLVVAGSMLSATCSQLHGTHIWQTVSCGFT